MGRFFRPPPPGSGRFPPAQAHFGCQNGQGPTSISEYGHRFNLRWLLRAIARLDVGPVLLRVLRHFKSAAFVHYFLTIARQLRVGVPMRSPMRWAAALMRAIQLATRSRCAPLEAGRLNFACPTSVRFFPNSEATPNGLESAGNDRTRGGGEIASQPFECAANRPSRGVVTAESDQKSGNSRCPHFVRLPCAAQAPTRKIVLVKFT